MNRKVNNNLWKHHMVGFVSFLALLLFLLFRYETIVFEKGGSTGSQAIRRFLRVVDNRWGKEYIIGVVVVFVVLTGVLAFRGYSKSKE
ncbi:MAG: hypothetical protein ACEPOZ_11500 [Marinifilaceae bacterium]